MILAKSCALPITFNRENLKIVVDYTRISWMDIDNWSTISLNTSLWIWNIDVDLPWTAGWNVFTSPFIVDFLVKVTIFVSSVASASMV